MCGEPYRVLRKRLLVSAVAVLSSAPIRGFPSFTMPDTVELYRQKLSLKGDGEILFHSVDRSRLLANGECVHVATQ